jgi:hypothetical protein
MVTRRVLDGTGFELVGAVLGIGVEIEVAFAVVEVLAVSRRGGRFVSVVYESLPMFREFGELELFLLVRFLYSSHNRCRFSLLVVGQSRR